MATSTFDKQIILDNKAATILADALEKKERPSRPNISKEKKESDAAWEKLLDRYKK